MMNLNSKVKLNNGIEMPWLGFGVFLTKEGKEVIDAVTFALDIGYRSIDTAAIYGNEEGVGKAVRESGISRSDIFITSKVWNAHQGYETTFHAFNKSLEKLQMDYLDLYLIHWPKGSRSVETWKAMEELLGQGRIKAIGISNFKDHHIADLLPHCEIIPAINQVEFHPELAQPELLEYCNLQSIRLEAWSPLMQGRVTQVPVLQSLATKYGKTPAQITLRWDLQKGVVTIPKSVTQERIKSNTDIFDFELSKEDIVKIDQLDINNRIGPDPDTIKF